MISVNIEAYDAESLRKLVRLLEYENRLLKDKLKKENIPYDEVNPFEETIDNVAEYDPDQGERIVNPTFITEEMATHFFSIVVLVLPLQRLPFLAQLPRWRVRSRK